MTIKKILLLCLLALSFSFNLHSQELEPVKWDSKVEKISDTEFNLIFKANIDRGWYIYSQKSNGGFAPTTFFDYKNQENNYALEGKTSEPIVAPIYDKIFEEEVVKFKDEAVFKQKIIRVNPDLKQIEVYIDYQVCDDSKCILGDYTFNFSLDGSLIEKKVVAIDERSKKLSEELNLNVSGWNKYEKQTVEEQSNFTIFY